MATVTRHFYGGGKCRYLLCDSLHIKTIPLRSNILTGTSLQFQKMVSSNHPDLITDHACGCSMRYHSLESDHHHYEILLFRDNQRPSGRSRQGLVPACRTHEN